MNKFEFDEYGKTGCHVVHNEKRLDEEVNLRVLRKIEACKCSCYNGLDYYEYGAVQAALEKQTPIEVLKIIGFPPKCPTCKRALFRYEQRYCMFCGQKLKWTKDE